MIAIGIAFNLAGLGIFCWLMFTAAVYAAPFFVAVTAGFYAAQTGAGPLGAVILALLAGVATLAAARLAFALIRTPVIRVAAALLFAAPAALAGFQVSHSLAALTIPSQAWQSVFAIVGAIGVGATAWTRLADAPPQGDASGAEQVRGPRGGLTAT